MQNLKTVFKNSPDNSGSATDGINVTAYGQGQCSGVTYTVSPHSEIDVDFTINMLCITPEGVDSLDKLIRGMLSASKKSDYDQLTKKSSSGGRGFFLFFSGGGSSSSYSQTTHTMESYGLTIDQQTKIIDAMLDLVSKTNQFVFKGKVSNTDYDYAVSGNMFAIVMDATIQKGETHSQVRFLAPNVHMNSTDGASSLPVQGKLY